ncbi:MAG: hypothetical protein ACOY3E_07290 [Pseudomonadota bacterium]
MRCVFVAVFVLALSTACVDKRAMLIHPTSKQIQYCHNKGWGWAGAPIASSEHNKCIANLKALGYRFPEEINSAPENSLASQTQSVNVVPEIGKSTESGSFDVSRYGNVREAKLAYESGVITKVEYQKVIFELKTKYEKAVFEAKQELGQGLIDKVEYKRRVAAARSDYEG